MRDRFCIRITNYLGCPHPHGRSDLVYPRSTLRSRDRTAYVKAPTRRRVRVSHDRYCAVADFRRSELGADEEELSSLHADARQDAPRAFTISTELDVHGAADVGAWGHDGPHSVARRIGRSVAEIYNALQAALEALDVDCTITPIPQEVPDLTPLHEDHRSAVYEPAAAQCWFKAATATASIFDE